jgi:DNA polymerase I-like protein with 3'-5' exonuclease and polymerase domains
MRLVFDIETTGLLKQLDRIHCITAIDPDTKQQYAFNGGTYDDGSPAPRDGSIEDGLRLLAAADELIGQNIIWFDIPAIQKLHPEWQPTGRIFDTKVAAQVIWSDMAERDAVALARGRLPTDFQQRGLMGKHSLEAWGFRLGVLKGDFRGPWDKFTEEMDRYARQDPVTTLALYEHVVAQNYSAECLELEHAVSRIIFRQHARGFAFDVRQAEQLTAKLQRRMAELSDELARTFRPWYAPDVKGGTALFVPKKDSKSLGYVAGAALSKVKEVVFNPASRDHIADRLKRLRGWAPKEFTPSGKPQVDETTLAALPWPEAQLLAEYLMVEKRLGQVAEGGEAWLKHATTAGILGTAQSGVARIHGNVNTNGAVTGRMTHSAPNVAQTPANHAPYGKDCRACFIATPGLVLVGCDAEGLELRMLAHYMAIYDGGAYVDAVVNGKKEDGTDAHSMNMRAAGLNTRDAAKTFIYALIYGAGDFKLGTISYEDFTEEQRKRFLSKHTTKRAREGALKRLGAARRARLLEGIPALGKLTDAVKQAVRKRGFLRGLDGRRLPVRSDHAALNTLLQSGGAVAMKKALVLADAAFTDTIRSKGGIVEPVANVHDEFQIETEEQYAELVGNIAAGAITKAGEHFKLRCPLAGSFSVGASWRDTH